MGTRRVLDTKTYWLTDRQSQYDFDFDLIRQSVISQLRVIEDWASIQYGLKSSSYDLSCIECMAVTPARYAIVILPMAVIVKL
jgi:hypothetical protein